MSRLFLDVSTIVRWSGPPVGIVRVEQELALHTLRHRRDIGLCLYDPASGGLRALASAWRDTLLGTAGIIETIWLETRRHRPAWRNALSPRFPLAMALERRRIRGTPWAAPLQSLLLGRDGRGPPYRDAAGARIALVPYRDAIGAPILPTTGDTVLSAGSDWLHKGPALVELQQRLGFRLAVLCYDLLPVTHPEWFFEQDVLRFSAYWRQAIPAAARILCNAQCVAQDLRDFAAAHGLGACAPTIVPLGYAPRASEGPLPPLPEGLRRGGYALFVSTIEPRKGHATLVAAWKALLARGIPQERAATLVFVGRRGWKTDALQAEIDAMSSRPEMRLRHLEGVGDAMLERLYRDAAFCLYPSRAEGFGLPVIEAMAHGRALIASNADAVAETAGGFAPCLDPLDAGAWADAIGGWIIDPGARAPWEARIAREFRHATWAEAAEAVFQAAAA